MSAFINFRIRSKGKLSEMLLVHGITEFQHAIGFVSSLPWGEITDNRRLELVATEQRGTTTTKHAFLAQLALENQVHSIKPVLCAFNMNAENTEAIDAILAGHCLQAIPEVVCLLKHNHIIYDVTSESMHPVAQIISDIEIAPLQINNFKKRYHLNYIENWLQIEKIKHKSVAEIWKIREECLYIANRRGSHHAQLCCA